MMVGSGEGKVVWPGALVVALAKQRVAATLPGIVISDLALKVSRSGSAALHALRAKLAKEVVSDQRGVEGAEVANLVGVVGEAVWRVVHPREV